MSNGIYKILLIDDDEDDYIIFRDLLSDINEVKYDLDWANNYKLAVETIKKGTHDIYFVDYRLGRYSGLELLREVKNFGCKAPLILLTGLGDHEVDIEAMKTGASDYLVKNEVTPSLLERSIRYALKHKKLEDELYKEKESAIVTLESIGDPVITTDTNGRITYLNFVAEKTTGWSNIEVQGVPLASFIKIINEIPRETIWDPVEQVLRQNSIVSFSGRYFFINREGRELAIEGTASPMRNRENQIVGIVIVFHDITVTHEQSRKISFQATHDALTGLINRFYFEEQLRILIEKAKNRNKEHALFYLDLDQFRIVNDTHGHFAGDQLLRQMVSLMKQQIEPSHIFARLGGDEFGILLEDCPVKKAYDIASAISKAVNRFRFFWNGKPFSMGISIGVVPINSSSENLDNVLRAADRSCFAAKQRGGGGIFLYRKDEGELPDQQGEIQWVAVINKSFEEKRFRLFYQPIIPLAPGEDRIQYEILMRVLNENGGLIYPGTFLPKAQKGEIFSAIDRWVVDTFFSFYAQNILHIYQNKLFTFNLNLSSASLSDEFFLDYIKKQFQQTKVPPEAICFEITEMAAIGNYNTALHLIKELSGLGCHFVLDNFGSELTSFNYLRDLPVDYVKIDGTLIKNMVDNEVDSVMVESINQIAHIMQIKTIAGFVENEAVYQKLKKINVDYVQGFYLAEPMPVEQMLLHNYQENKGRRY